MLYKMEGFYRQKGRKRKFSNKEWIVLGKVTFLWGKGRQAH